MPDYSAQRSNMVDSQIRTVDVTDERILDAMREIPREMFVPVQKRAVAYAEVPVSVTPGRALLGPPVFARLLQLAEIEPGDSVLDVGCATGYSSAVIAKLARKVTCLEQDADLVRIASETLHALGTRNATVVQGALDQGHKGNAPYSAIFVNGAVEFVPDALFAQLADGGRLVAVVQTGSLGKATLFVKEKGRLGSRPGFDAGAPMLPGFRKAVGFVF